MLGKRSLLENLNMNVFKMRRKECGGRKTEMITNFACPKAKQRVKDGDG